MFGAHFGLCDKFSIYFMFSIEKKKDIAEYFIITKYVIYWLNSRTSVDTSLKDQVSVQIDIKGKNLNLRVKYYI